jgi:type IV pilus assembly protein PilC
MRNSSPEIISFTKHLATLTKAGVPIAESLASLAEQPWSSAFKSAIKDILRNINNGQSLAKSLGAHPKIFNQYYISFIEIGEEAGTLEENLAYLSEQLYKDSSSRKRVETAMLYPAIVLTTAFLIGGSISLFILPKLVDFFASFEMELPLATRLLLSFANLMKTSGPLIFLGIFLIIAFFSFLFSQTPFKSLWGAILLKLPIVGRVNANLQLIRFSRNLGTLLKSGVPIVRALDVTEKTLSNSVYKRALSVAVGDVEKGKSLSDSISKNKIFPSLITKMISVGEKSGKLDESLLYLADYYDDEMENFNKNLSIVIEPILLIFIGLIVGFIALAIISPIYQLTGSLGRQ